MRYPESADEEFLKTKLDKSEVKDKVNSYPQEAELKKMTSLPIDDIYCNPALSFKQEISSYGLSLIAAGKPDDYYFSVRYSFPVRKKILFGLYIQKKIEVIKKNFAADEAHSLLNMFLEENYTLLQKQMSD